MVYFLLGVSCGFGLAVAGMVVWNLQSPLEVDELERALREEFGDDWERIKQRARSRIRGEK